MKRLESSFNSRGWSPASEENVAWKGSFLTRIVPAEFERSNQALAELRKFGGVLVPTLE